MLHTRKPLYDRFGRKHTYLRISVTERCNLRCTYCMPAKGIDLVPQREILTFEEIIRLTKLFASMGVDKIRLTGGEPLIRKGVTQLISKIRDIDGIKTIAMTTNGVLLSKNLEALKNAGLDKINLSLDTLNPERFAKIARRDYFNNVITAFNDAISEGFTPLKVNMVPIRGVNEDELLDFVALTKNNLIDVRFIEFMPFDQNQWHTRKLITFKQMHDIISTKYPLTPCEHGDPNTVANTYSIKNHKGTISFISSITNSFCGGCNRIRLLADGALKNCLFSNQEISLRDAMRQGASDDTLEIMIRDCFKNKQKQHDSSEMLLTQNNRSMIKIGG